MGYIVEAEELLCGHRKAGWMGTSPGNTDYSDLRELLTSNAEDTALCEAYDRLLVSWSCEGAAKGYLAALGFICVSRPHLADRLLCRPIDALLQLGAENAEAVASFVGYLCGSRPTISCSGREMTGFNGFVQSSRSSQSR